MHLGDIKLMYSCRLFVQYLLNMLNSKDIKRTDNAAKNNDGLSEKELNDGKEVLKKSVIASNVESSMNMSMGVLFCWRDQMISQFWLYFYFPF